MKIAKTQSSLLTDVVMSLVADSIFNLDMGKSAESFSKMNSKKSLSGILLILETRDFPYPQNRQYCHIANFQTNESGWVSSEFLEKIK